ncbi:MAG: hypothetical protein Greene041619_1042 [Candidatus Peregrinibacteria bacterium Greene0416_19]|nr:MAG: hypothetical protein Greene041619_1042 [Candidatus Peregrinibacteria bacterium Greene0416_19]
MMLLYWLHQLQFTLSHLMVRHAALFLWHLPRRALVALISVYQQTLSPDHGPLKRLHLYGYCRHEPTCSAYAKNVIETRGAVIGCLLTMKRLLGCHPWRKPDADRIMRVSYLKSSSAGSK